jgi:iron complex outermembrane receptor protein
VAAKLSYNHMETDGWADNHYDGASAAAGHDIEDDCGLGGQRQPTASRCAGRRREPDVDYAYDKTDNEGVPAPFQVTEGARQALQLRRLQPDAVPLHLPRRLAVPADGRQVGDPDKRRDDFSSTTVDPEWLEVEGHTSRSPGRSRTSSR